MIAIIDYGFGNINSVANMLTRVGANCKITSDEKTIGAAEQILIPGNGSFDACMIALKQSNLVPILFEKVMIQKVPTLGICVGAQILGNLSSEGSEKGLGWIDMATEKFPAMEKLKVPNMGWRKTEPNFQSTHPIANQIKESYYYFVHSYYMVPKNSSEVVMYSTYGIRFAAAIGRENILGVQFHPEKSHRFGKVLFEKFLGI